jgi:hypothetical protein
MSHNEQLAQFYGDGTATRLDAVLVHSTWHDSNSGLNELVVECADYDVYATLPRVVEYKGATYGLTGWNSDRGQAYYRDDVQVARARR